MSDVYKVGKLPVAGNVVESIATQKLPASITLTSTAAGRKIELSYDAVNYVAATPTVTDPAFITFHLAFPAALVRLTGNSGDDYNIRSAG